jgi:hypothetical protein
MKILKLAVQLQTLSMALAALSCGIVSACHRGDSGAMGHEIESRYGVVALKRSSKPDLQHLRHLRLPDFAKYNIPKQGKYTKRPQNIPNDHKKYQTTTKYTKRPQNIPNDHKIDQKDIKYSKWPLNLTKILGSNAFPNSYAWYANIPSGNPGDDHRSDASRAFFIALSPPHDFRVCDFSCCRF